jgi:hypothetical protein
MLKSIASLAQGFTITFGHFRICHKNEIHTAQRFTHYFNDPMYLCTMPLTSFPSNHQLTDHPS